MESTFRKRIKRLFSDSGAWCYITHNPLQKGIPDLHVVYDGQAIWLEVKYTENPPQLPHPLSPQQSRMLRDIHQAGGYAGMLVGTPEGCCLIHADTLQPGKTRTFNASLKPAKKWVKQTLKSVTDGST